MFSRNGVKSQCCSRYNVSKFFQLFGYLVWLKVSATTIPFVEKPLKTGSCGITLWHSKSEWSKWPRWKIRKEGSNAMLIRTNLRINESPANFNSTNYGHASIRGSMLHWIGQYDKSSTWRLTMFPLPRCLQMFSSNLREYTISKCLRLGQHAERASIAESSIRADFSLKFLMIAKCLSDLDIV